MSIILERETEPDGTGGEMTKQFVIKINHVTSMDAFKRMVNRAMNTWDEAPPELKDFADLLIHGHILQNYHRSTLTKTR